MDIYDRDILIIKLRKILKLLLIQIVIAFVVLFAGYLINSMGFEFRTLAVKIFWDTAAIWGIIFAWFILRICRITFFFPQQSKGKRMVQKTISIVVSTAIVVTTVCAYMTCFIFLACTVKKEHTISYKDTIYIKKYVSRAVTPSGVTYHKVVNPFLYEEQQTTDIISIETYTGVIRSWKWSGGDDGWVRCIQVDIGSTEMIEFTLMHDDMMSDPMPVNVKVQIVCEHHPNSEYRPILSISLQ